MKRVLSLVLALTILLGMSSALAEVKEIDGITERKIKIHSAGLNTDPEEMIRNGISPTTGRKLSEIAENIPDGFLGTAVTGQYQPIMVQISNANNGVGYEKKTKKLYTTAPVNAGYADVVYEALQKRENSESRMTMIFSDLVPDYVGFLRSTRLTHVRLRQEWDCAFCTSGYSRADVPAEWKKLGVMSPESAVEGNPGLVYVGDFPKVWKKYVWRLHPYSSPNNELFMLADIVRDIIPKDHKAANHTFLFTDDLPTGGDSAEIIYVTFGNPLETNSRLEYNPDTNTYTRYVKVQGLKDQPYRDSRIVNPVIKMVPDGKGGRVKKVAIDERYIAEEITFSNVIVQGVKMKWKGFNRPDPEMVGVDNADYFMGGRHFAGVWERKDINSRTVFYGEDGNEIYLQRGRTLIIMMPYSDAVGKNKYKKNDKRGVKYE